ncbi:MAG: 3D domain-containing protein [Alphaproteobacteria bacterium]|nr:3D domain-containing protein [Alphaproteobacteria bacterium]
MNYSRNIKKPTYKRFRRVLCFGLIIGFVAGLIIGGLVGRCTSAKALDAMPVETDTATQTMSATGEPEAPDSTPEPIDLGTYRVTAYCSCEKCCGEWALNRPNGIVYGASGEELKQGVSVASTLPFGSVIEIEGLGQYIVQDRIAQWVIDKYGENQVDVYFSDHGQAVQFGLQNLEVYLIQNGGNESD